MNPTDPDEVLQTILRSDEQLLWSGRPRPLRATFGGVSLIMIGVGAPVSLFVAWGLLAVVRTASSGGAATLGAILFGLPFGIVALTLATAPYWAYRKAQRTLYAVTSARVLALTVWPSTRSLQAIDAAQIGEVRVTERGSAEGDLLIRPQLDPAQGAPTPLVFFGISSVRSVEGLVQSITARTKSSGQ
jgi:hypothetical protein